MIGIILCVIPFIVMMVALAVFAIKSGPTLRQLDKPMRMELALTKIQQWDCLNPPRTDLCGDLAWLKRVVDEALED